MLYRLTGSPIPNWLNASVVRGRLAPSFPMLAAVVGLMAFPRLQATWVFVKEDGDSCRCDDAHLMEALSCARVWYSYWL